MIVMMMSLEVVRVRDQNSNILRMIVMMSLEGIIGK